ncbi:MAG TPA: GNAT family protein [Myxococcota bacterium]|nr:GNAT family protein [Myxococcota bacterium]
MPPGAIETDRLRLVPMGPAFLRASLAGDGATAQALLGARLPEDWAELAPVLRLRLGQLERVPAHEPWLTRAIVLASEARVIGVSGFHGPPGGAWLHEFAPGGVEFGYTVFPGDRRRGYAAEASEALVQWASEEHGVRRFVLSIGPANVASAGLAAKLGFRRVGEWLHAERGLEHVWLRVTGT